MPQVDIDFEVFKALTSRRPTEDVTYNDVIRDLLGLSRTARSRVSSTSGEKPWIVSDTAFPAGSEFTSDYKGKTYMGVVREGKLQLSDGRRFSTPSAAAMYVTGTNVNGWRFWKCRLPSASRFILIERLRGKTH